LAAYNWGPGNVRKAIESNRKKGLGIGYADLRLPEETRLYVPKIQAMKNLIADPQRFDVELPPIDNHPYYDNVEITNDMDVALVVKLAEVSMEDFRALNPSLKGPVILAASNPKISLPWKNAQIFRNNLQSWNEGPYASWTVWTVPTNINIASAAQRVGMSEAELRKANNIPQGMLIKAGSVLFVPRVHETQNDVAEKVAANGQIAFAPEKKAQRTAKRISKTPVKARSSKASTSKTTPKKTTKPVAKPKRSTKTKVVAKKRKK